MSPRPSPSFTRSTALPVRRRLGEGGSLSKGPALSLSKGPALNKRSASNGFTIVEVMMASVILVVGFMGMIQAITIGSEMLSTARRQTVANQIITHEVEKLRLKTWAQISALTSTFPVVYTSDLASLNTSINNSGVIYSLEIAVRDVTTGLREVRLEVQWHKEGTNTAAPAPSGSWLDRLAFSRNSPIARDYTRVGVAYFGQYGLNLNSQR